MHRIGRTGRAGKQGTAITFVSPSEFRGLNNLMRDIKVEIKRETLPSPQDIVEMKRLKIKEEMQEIVENESYDGYKEFAEELLAEYTPDVALGALLRLAFRSELDQNNYPEIRSFSSTARVRHGCSWPWANATATRHASWSTCSNSNAACATNISTTSRFRTTSRS